MPLPKIIAFVLTGIAWESLFRNLGGAAVVFRASQTLLFGKTIRTFEYPHGNMKTILLRINSVDQLRSGIARVNGISDPAQIKFISKYEEWFFTEPVDDNGDVRALKEHQIILWTRGDVRIPPRGVNLKEMKAEEELTEEDKEVEMTEGVEKLVEEEKKKEKMQVHAINLLMNKGRAHGELGEKGLTDDEMVLVTDWILNDDPYMLSLYDNFKHSPETFIKHAKKKSSEVLAQQRERLMAQQQQQQQQNAAMASATLAAAEKQKPPGQSHQTQQQKAHVAHATGHHIIDGKDHIENIEDIEEYLKDQARRQKEKEEEKKTGGAESAAAKAQAAQSEQNTGRQPNVETFS